MVVGVGAVIATQQTNPVYATESPVKYGTATFSKALPNDGYWAGTGGSYCGGYGKNKDGAWSATLDFDSATGIDWTSVDFTKTVKLTTSVKAAGNSASGSVTLSIDNTDAQSVTRSIGDFGSGSNTSSAKVAVMNIDSVSGVFSKIALNFPAKTFIHQFSCELTFTEKNVSGPKALANPNPKYDDESKEITWTKDSNATKYQIKVDSGSYADIETEKYDARSLTADVEHTVYIKAVGDETSYSSTEGSVKFTPTPYEVHRKFTITSATSITETGDKITSATASYYQTNHAADGVGKATKDDSMTLSITGLTTKVTINKLVLSMKSNASAGSGAIAVIIDGNEPTFIAGTSVSEGTGFNSFGDNTSYCNTFRKVTWKDLSFVAKTSIEIKIYCTVNSLYCEYFNIYFTEAVNSDYVSAFSVTPSTWNGYTTSVLRVSDFTVSATTGEGQGTKDDYIFLGIGHMEDGEFVARDSHFFEGHPQLTDTRLYWKAKYPTTPGGSTYLYAYVTLTVSDDTLSAIAIEGKMDKTSYYSTDRWQFYGLTVNAVYASGNKIDVAYFADITYYTDAEMTNEVASPEALGVGNNQSIYIKATYEGISNAVGYLQTVTVTYEHGYLITDPLTADEAIEIGAQRGNNGETQVEYYVRGTVISVVANQLDQEGKNKYATFYLEENNDKYSFEAFKIAPSASCTNYEDLKEGAVVLLRCRLKNYLNTTIENGSTGELVSISYTKPVLTNIVLDKTAIAIAVGGECTLKVSGLPIGAELGEVTWTSSNDAVATVTNGTIKGIAAGSATITASANGVTATCNVDVFNNSAKMSYSGSDTGNMTATDNAETVGLDAKLFTVDASKGSTSLFPGLNSNGEIRLYKDSNGDNGSSFTVKMNSKFTIAAIQVEFKSGDQYATVYAGAKEVTSANNSIYEINAESFTIKDTGSDTIKISAIDIYYRGADVRETVSRLSTQTSLAYNYTRDAEDNFTYSDIVIRFGANISKEMWNALAAENEITGFGVMIADGEMVKNSKDFVEVIEGEMFTSSAVSTDVVNNYAIDYFVPIANMGTTIGENDDNYFWNLRFSVDSANIGTMYSAVAYIKVGSEYVVMNMARESVKTVAADYIANRGCDNTTAGGSLAALAK